MLLLDGGMWGCAKKNKCLRCFWRCCHETKLIAKFTCTWMYQTLFRLSNNSALGSFHHLPSLPPLLPALLATRAVHFGGIVGESPRPWSLTSHCHLAKATSSALFVTWVTQLGTPRAVTARLHLSSSREEFPTDLSIPEALSRLEAVKVSMKMQGLISTQSRGSCKEEALSPVSLRVRRAEAEEGQWIALHQTEPACSLSSLIWKQSLKAVCLGGLL